MREELRTIGSKGRHVFTATFVRFGFRNGYIGPVKTMLLQDVTLDSKIVSDHLWFDLTKGFSGADLSPGDVVEFCARVSAYEKGYKGHNELRKRYDMAFAAFVVDNMRKQNMLKDDKIAELLKDNPNEK